MRIKALPLLTCLLVLMPSLLMNSLPRCSAQSSTLQITHDEYQWTGTNAIQWSNDMKRLGMTTPERGLILKIIIYNNSTEQLELDNLYIIVRVDSDNTQTSFSFRQQINFDSGNKLYLPPHESDYRFVKIAHLGMNLQIGSYTAKLSYYRYTTVYGEGTPIEPYPFYFKVASEETLQQTIAQNTPVINQVLIFGLIISVVVLIVIGITLIVMMLSGKQNARASRKQRNTLLYIEVVAAIVTCILAGLSLYLQLIKW